MRNEKEILYLIQVFVRHESQGHAASVAERGGAGLQGVVDTLGRDTHHRGRFVLGTRRPHSRMHWHTLRDGVGKQHK